MYEEVFKKKPKELLEWLTDNFYIPIPDAVLSIEDMDKAAEFLLRTSANYQYLNALLSYAKLATREAKREKRKEEYEDMVDKKEIISNVVDAIKQSYAAVSRAVTIRIENNEELRMSEKRG